jgi:hypothetical protein
VYDDFDRLRARRGDARPVDPGLAGRGSPSFVGKVTTTGGSLGVGKFFKVNPVVLTGAETEGGAATATVDTSTTILVYAVGPTAPATNDLVVCRYVRYRWVADNQSGVVVGGGPSPGFGTCCPSNPVPATASISFTFRSGTNAATYSSQTINTTLTFMTTTPAYASGLANRYFSPTFVDDLGQTLYYSIGCSIGIISLNLGFVASGFLQSCCTIPLLSCSPFLVSGTPNGPGGGAGSCFSDSGNPMGTGFVFGGDPADTITIS